MSMFSFLPCVVVVVVVVVGGDVEYCQVRQRLSARPMMMSNNRLLSGKDSRGHQVPPRPARPP